MAIDYYGIIIVEQSQTEGADGFTYAQEVSEVSSGRLLTMERFTSAGEDAAPLPGDAGLSVPVQRTGGAATAGFIDTVNAPIAKPGERRTYSRNSDGEITSTIYQKNDGTIDVINDGFTLTIAPDGTITMDADGDANINVAGTTNLTCPTTNVDGNINCTGDITADGTVTGKTDVLSGDDEISGKGHEHISNGPGNSTNPPTP